MCLVPDANQRDIKPALSNSCIDQQNTAFCHHYFNLTETSSLHTEEKHQGEFNTTSPWSGYCNIFHSRSFYVGFKHAISQFNPIFSSFRSTPVEQIPSNIKHMAAVAPGSTAAVLCFFLLTLKASLLCSSANHCQLSPMSIVIDNK